MKKYFSVLFAGLAVAGVLSGCSHDDFGNGQDGNKPSAGNTVNFTLGGPTTRTVYDDEDEYQINWTEGDQVRIYCNEAEDVKQADYSVIKSLGPDAENTGTLRYNENGLAWGSESTHNFFAVYPADDSKVSVENGIATFKVNQNQVCTFPTSADSEGNYMGTPDMTNAYMVAHLSTTPIDEVPLRFSPIMTTLQITVKGREGDVAQAITVTGISIVNENVTSSDAQLGQFKYDITNGSIADSETSATPTTETTFVQVSSGGNNFLELDAGQSATFTVFLPPLPINSDNKITIRVHATGETTQEATIGGTEAEGCITDATGQAVTYKASAKGKLSLAWFPTEQNGNNWITPLDDNIYVSQLSIPGTHDAATGDGTTFSIGKTQDRTLDQQFEMGIRCFDLRPAVSASGLGDDISIYHGAVQTTYTWDNIMERFKYYLQTNPGEFIIIIMRHEDEGDGLDTRDRWGDMMLEKLQEIKNTINSSTGESFTVDFRPDLTVGDMRGKILFLCRDWTPYADSPTVGGYTGWSHSPAGAEVNIYGVESNTTGKLNIQDCYAPTEDGASTIFNNQYPTIKWNAIVNLLEKSRTFHTDPSMINRWSINHTSGYTGFISSTDGYRENAANNNIKLYNKLNSQEWQGSTGIMILDFVGARSSGDYQVFGDLCPQAIIDNNYKYRPQRRGE